MNIPKESTDLKAPLKPSFYPYLKIHKSLSYEIFIVATNEHIINTRSTYYLLKDQEYQSASIVKAKYLLQDELIRLCKKGIERIDGKLKIIQDHINDLDKTIEESTYIKFVQLNLLKNSYIQVKRSASI